MQPCKPLFHKSGFMFVFVWIHSLYMGEIEKRSGAEATPWWYFIPGGAFAGAAYGLAQMEVWSGAVIGFLGLIATVAVSAKNGPRDIDSWKIYPMTKADKRRAWMHFLVPFGVMGADLISGDSLFTLSPEISAVLSGTAMGAAATFSMGRISTIAYKNSRERIQMIVNQASLDSVSTSDLEAIDRTEPQLLIRALLAHGAIDGTRVMARQLAKVLDWDIARVHAVAGPLDKRGITGRSSIMAGDDRGKIFVELTQKGVVLMKELAQGR